MRNSAAANVQNLLMSGCDEEMFRVLIHMRINSSVLSLYMFPAGEPSLAKNTCCNAPPLLKKKSARSRPVLSCTSVNRCEPSKQFTQNFYSVR